MAISFDRKKFPIGTRVRFIASQRSCPSCRRDNGKIGKVTEYLAGLIGIYLPESGNNHHKEPKETTWFTNPKNLQILPQKNEQLTFAFMD